MVEPLNWTAVLVGTGAGFLLGMFWFGPGMFGRAWTTGSHGITPPAKLPLLAMACYLGGTFLLALLIGLTATIAAFGTALTGIGAATALVLGSALFSQKSVTAALIDAGHILAMGALMIGVQGAL